MCAVYRHIELKFVVVSARTRATSMSRLCRNFSNIRIRLAVEIPLILSVATLYIYIYICHTRCGWPPLHNHGLCGVVCRILLLVLNRYMTSFSVSLCLQFGFRIRSVSRVNFLCLSLFGVLSFLPIVATFWTLLVGFTFLHLDRVISLFCSTSWGGRGVAPSEASCC